MTKRIMVAGAAALLMVAAPLLAQRAPRPTDYAQALVADGRPSADLQRDEDRKPADMLAFAGVQPGWKVAELAPGGGYFTRLLSLTVGPRGKVYANSSRPLPWLAGWTSAHPNVVLQASPLPTPLAPEPVDLRVHDGVVVAERNADSINHAGPPGGRSSRRPVWTSRSTCRRPARLVPACRRRRGGRRSTAAGDRTRRRRPR